jgi:hypothetical protein
MDLSSLGSIPQAVATVFAAGVALYVSRNWRRQEVGKRRQMVAEEALLTAYEAKRAIDAMRMPHIFNSELEEATGARLLAPGEHSPWLAVPVATRRYERHRAIWAKLEGAALLVSVHFGASASTPMAQLHRQARLVISEIVAGLEPEIDRAAKAKSSIPDPVLGYRWRPDGLMSRDPEDEKIRQTVSAIEQNLKPHLRMPGERDPDAPCHGWWGKLRRR